MVAPKMCKTCGNPPLVINDVLNHRFVVACASKCVPDVSRGAREDAVALWNKKTAGVASGV
jgi:ferredoxin